MPQRPFRPLALLAFTAWLVGCGGGGSSSDSSNAGIDGSGAPATVAVAGPINGFGSVIVNGVHYDTQQALITVNGQSATEAALNVGSYISLQGTLNSDGKTGTATHISYQPNVRGAIARIDAAADSFEVLGQTVHISDATAFDFAISPRSVAGLALGQWVEVSGASDASGAIQASRIALAPSAPAGLAGDIQQLDALHKTFTINQVTVSYANVTNPPVLQEGQRVILRDLDIAGATLRAKTLDLDPGLQAVGAVAAVEKTGVITRFNGSTDFYLGDVPVTTNPQTQFVGTSAASLALNMKLTVKGRLTPDRRLMAERIESLASADWQLVGPITQVENLGISGGRILVQNTWITLDTRTRLDSDLSGDGNRMKFANLRNGDQVVVSGRLQDGIYLASVLEVEELEAPQMPEQLRGQVRSLDAALGRFSLFGVTVTINSNTEFWWEDRAIAATTFYAQGAEHQVEVRGTFVGGQLQAQRVKILNSGPGAGPLFAPQPPAGHFKH